MQVIHYSRKFLKFTFIYIHIFSPQTWRTWNKCILEVPKNRVTCISCWMVLPVHCFFKASLKQNKKIEGLKLQTKALMLNEWTLGDGEKKKSLRCVLFHRSKQTQSSVCCHIQICCGEYLRGKLSQTFLSFQFLSWNRPFLAFLDCLWPLVQESK